jgi:serine/threonine protein kinase, bacterial
MDNWAASIRARYKFVRSLSIGVCLAEDKDRKLVVIKKSGLPGPDGWPTYDNIEKEMEIHSKLNYPNIVKLVDWHREKGLFIVTQYVDGESLARRFFLKPGDHKEVLSILLQLTKAVAYLHSMGVIHRDITPENVIISGGKPFLIDFGAAAYFSPAEPLRMYPMTVCINERIFFVNPWCRPPEIGMGSLGEGTFPASDVFYLGAAAVFMLTGRFFRKEYVEHELDFVSKINPTVSNDFLEILKKAMAEKVELRFQDGFQLLEALQRLEK